MLQLISSHLPKRKSEVAIEGGSAPSTGVHQVTLVLILAAVQRYSQTVAHLG